VRDNELERERAAWRASDDPSLAKPREAWMALDDCGDTRYQVSRRKNGLYLEIALRDAGCQRVVCAFGQEARRNLGAAGHRLSSGPIAAGWR